MTSSRRLSIFHHIIRIHESKNDETFDTSFVYQDWFMMQSGINMMIYRRADSSELRRVPVYIRFIHAIRQDIQDTTRRKECTLTTLQPRRSVTPLPFAKHQPITIWILKGHCPGIPVRILRLDSRPSCVDQCINNSRINRSIKIDHEKILLCWAGVEIDVLFVDLH